MSDTNRTIAHLPFRSKLDLMGIRFMADENQDGAGAGGTGEQEHQQENDAPWTKENFDPERAYKLLQNVRGDLTAEKSKRESDIAAAVEQAQKETLAQFGRLLSGEKEPETDPVKLQQSLAALQGTVTEKDTALTQAQEAAKSSARSTQVAIHAATLGGNAALLLSNQEFQTSIASVEPTDEAAIKAAITKAIQANAALKAPSPRSGGGEHQGGDVQSLEAQLKSAEEKKDQMEIIRLTRAVVAARRTQA